MKRIAFISSLGFLVIACGDDGGGNDIDAGADATAAVSCPGSQGAANPGFICPTAVATAWTEDQGVFTEVGPADFSCLGTPSTDTATTVDVNLSGLVVDFQTNAPVADATVSLFPGVDSATVLATATSGADGSYAMTMPTGQVRVGYLIAAADYLDTFLLNQYFEPDTADQTRHISAVSVNTANLLPAIIGITRTPGLGVLAAAIRDCSGNTVSNVIATVSGTSGSHDHLDGGQSYYFSNGLPTNLTVQQQTNNDGLFVVLELPPSETAYLQVWGFTSEQDPAIDALTLLGEIPAPIVGDTVVSASLEPLRN